MAELYLFDQDDNFITILSEEEGLVDTWFKDYENHLIDEPFVFNMESNSPLLQHIKEENQVAFYDRDGDLRLVRMKELYEVTNQDGNNIRVKCEPSFLELYDHFIEDKRVNIGTAQTALDRVLEGSRYVGEVTVELGDETVNFYWIDGISAVWKILNTWGGFLRDTITLNDKNEIVERRLWIVQRLGTDSGLIVEPDHNAETISRNTLSYPETALWGQGSSLPVEDDEGEHTGGYTRYLTFEDVEWSVSNGDPVDKPKGQKWVGDPDALQQFGYLHNGSLKHRYGHYSNQDYDDPEELLWATWNNLQERKLKEIIYEARIFEDDKPVSLGDTVTVVNREYNKPIELQSQITGLEYDILDDKEINIIVGKYIDMNDDPLERELDDIKDIINRPAPPISDDSFPDVVPTVPQNVVAVGGFRIIDIYWDFDFKPFFTYEVYGSQNSEFIPAEQFLLWKGQVSGFSHNVDTDEHWYYYVRAINTHGTAGGFSEQVDAMTVQLDLPDVENLVPDFLELNIISSEEMPEGTDFHQGQIWEQINLPDGPNFWHRWSIIFEKWLPITATNAGQLGAVDSGSYEERMSEITDVITDKVDGIWVDNRLQSKANADEVYTIYEMDNALDARVSKTEYYVDQEGYVEWLEELETTVEQTERDIRLKASQTDLETVEDELGRVGTKVTEAEATLVVHAEAIEQRVTKVEFNTVTGEINDYVSQVEQTAENITQIVSALEVKFDELNIPNRNLAKEKLISVEPEESGSTGEAFHYVLTRSRNESNRTTERLLIKTGQNLESRTDYVLSFKYKKLSGDVPRIGCSGTLEEAQHLLDDESEIYLNGDLVGVGREDWIAGIVVPDNFTTNTIEIHVNNSNMHSQKRFDTVIQGTPLSTVGSADIWEIKIEEGTVRTPWIPAPEDGVSVGELTTQITSLQTQIDQNAESITLRATKTEVDLINDKVTDSEAAIQLNADEIALKVSKNGVMSAIEQTAEQIKISALRLDFGNGALIVQNGNVYIRDNVIVDSMIAANAQIDFAKISNVRITNAMITSLSVTKLTGSTATFTQNSWNNITSQVRITGTGLETYSGGTRTSALNGTGHSFYRNSLLVGRIGTSGWIGDSSYRGLLFSLENRADYMTWAFRQNASDTNPTTMLAWHKTTAKTTKGFTFYDDVRVSAQYNLEVRTLTTTGYSTGRYHVVLQNYTFNSKFGVSLVRGGEAQGARVHLTTSSAYLISSGNAYLEIGRDGTGNFVKSIDVYNRRYTSTSQMMRVTQNGVLGMSTSSRRFKLLEEEIELEYAKRILGVLPKRWFDKRSAEDCAHTLSTGEDTEVQRVERIGGVIAEDLVDAGLEMYVTYDEYKRVDGISENFVTLLIPIVAEHEDKLTVIEPMVTDHESRINELESENEQLKNRILQLEETVA